MPGRVKFSEMGRQEQLELGEFYDMVASLKNRVEAKNFFKDLMSLSEIVMVSRRIQIAKRLLKGDTYREIIEKMKVGKSTVASVDKWVNLGFDGYREVIKSYEVVKKSRGVKDCVPDFPFSLGALRKKYPAHFMLLNVVDLIKGGKKKKNNK